MRIDLRAAMNAVSEITMNRPLPIREFDQIYMRSGDIILHAEYIARNVDGKNLIFVGDGDAIGLTTVWLKESGVLDYGPSSVTILDFDERVVNSVNEFADDHGIENVISGTLYNVIDPIPSRMAGQYDAFHINPPWGQYNDGESVRVFFERGSELGAEACEGFCVIADSNELTWTDNVLANVQADAINQGFVVKEMIPAFHSYHLDDAPDLKSCVLKFRRRSGNAPPSSKPLRNDRLASFYGRDKTARVRYVRDAARANPDTAVPGTYTFETMKEG
jgi:predicted methyltransferase